MNHQDPATPDAALVAQLERWLADQTPPSSVDDIVDRVLGALPSVDQEWSWRWYQDRPGSLRERMRVIRLSARTTLAALAQAGLATDGVMGHIALRPESEFEVGLLADELLITDVEGHVLARVERTQPSQPPGQ